MVWPVRDAEVCNSRSMSGRWAMAFAATSIAGLNRNPPAASSEATSDRTSLSSASSPAQACRKNSARSTGGRSSAACSRSSTRLQRSDSIARRPSRPTGQFAVEPRPGGTPIAHHGDRRDFEHFRGLFHTESAKEAHFDYLHLAGILPRQRVHRVIQGYQVGSPIVAHHGRFFQRYVLYIAPAFQIVAARMVHQDAPHQLRRDSEEMCAILPLHARIVHQAHIGFIYQCGGLQAVAGVFPFQVAPRQPPQLFVNDGGELFERALISAAPGVQERADLTLRRFTGLCPLRHCASVDYTAPRVLRPLRHPAGWHGVLTGLREFSARLRGPHSDCASHGARLSLPQSLQPSDSDGCRLLESESYKEKPSDSDGFERQLARKGTVFGAS